MIKQIPNAITSANLFFGCLSIVATFDGNPTLAATYIVIAAILDFFDGFASELSKLDEVVLMPIYPARELPIPGVTSEKLLGAITCENKQLLDHQGVIDCIMNSHQEVVLTIGAGDIDRIVEPLRKALQ